ncbi:hypothetical protein DPMN_166977 [Dreissena polymorpha]|uniref:Reverse transcriptase domain-containing protein n=1 Tax=Dreissena polymorpha TaxID=45954 RepID=A0A9D4EXX4_DREPO|nr:hypothetical protein DPMN_166977 [Dreissena polymorpha]
MQEALRDHHTSVSIGRSISILKFADDIDLVGGTSSELQDLTYRIYKITITYMIKVRSK